MYVFILIIPIKPNYFFQAGIIFTLLGAADVVEDKEMQQKMRGESHWELKMKGESHWKLKMRAK